MVWTLFSSQTSPTPFARIKAHLKVVAAASLLFASHSSLAYQAPGFRVPEIVMRANSGHSYNIPPETYFGLENPLFTNENDIVLQYIAFDGQERQGLLKFNRSDAQLQNHESVVGSFPSGILWDPVNRVFYYEDVNEGFFSNGLVRLSRDFSKAEKIVSDKSIQFISDIGLIDQSKALISRSKYSNGSQKINLIRIGQGSQDSTIEKSLLSTTHEDPKSSFSYFFTPSSTASGFAALKVRIGKAGELAESQPDMIMIFKWNDSTRSLKLVHQILDRDALSSSPFASFDNSVVINEAGKVLFVATLSNGRRALYSWCETENLLLLAEEGKTPGLEEIMRFAPDMNNLGEVVFRSRSSEGESIWHVSQTRKLTRLLGRGDTLKSDLGPARVGPSDPSEMSFYLAPRINDKGIVLVGALLDLQGPNARPIGLGFYLIKPE